MLFLEFYFALKNNFLRVHIFFFFIFVVETQTNFCSFWGESIKKMWRDIEWKNFLCFRIFFTNFVQRKLKKVFFLFSNFLFKSLIFSSLPRIKPNAGWILREFCGQFFFKFFKLSDILRSLKCEKLFKLN